jgi:transposase-like protein
MSKELNLTDLAKIYNDDDRIREFFEGLRWPDGPVCPHCESKEVYRLSPKPDSESPVRKGVLKCKKCRKQFTVTVNTIFEGSHIPLAKWIMAIHFFCSSKTGISAHQLHRLLGITYKTAWFIAHRIRYAMTQSPLKEKLKGIVEADETYIGGKGKGKRGRGAEKKTAVFSLVERNGRIKSQPIGNVKAKTLKKIMIEYVDRKAKIMTDEFPSYRWVKKHFASHEVVDHAKKEYVRGNIHVNAAEGYFSLLKRAIDGTFHHISKHHLHRYVSEFDFRYNYSKVDDGMRTAILISRAENKRLLYR